MRHPKLLALSLLTLLLLASCRGATSSELSDQPALIPLPNKLEWSSTRAYTFGNQNTISIPQEVKNRELLTEQLNQTLRSAGLKPLTLTQNDEGASVRVTLDSSMPSTAYTLTSDHIYKVGITAGSPEGAQYAIQTLRQLVTPQGFAEAVIEDEPRFGYRGVMLDVSRHFMSTDFIKQLLDELQFYKLNHFHWHLTDAGGWRLQIKQYPELTRKVAFRTQSDWTEWWIYEDRTYLDGGTEGAYGGYYTQDEVREIVAYAAERGITVIPEIEMPGHSEEVLYAYPQFSCSGKALPHESDFCIGNEETFTFLQNVLDEVMELFPSEYIHIGGDEAGKKAWATCPKCKDLMRREGISSLDELQSYLIHRIEEYLNSKGRRIIGWDEILEGGLAPNATVMSWWGEQGGIDAAKAGHQVIMTPNSHLYLDYYQEDPTRAERKAIGGYIPLERTYSYDPTASLPEEAKSYVAGVQANLWTEYVLDEEHAAYMLFPRVLALSEVAWTNPELKTWESFRKRVNVHVPMLHERGINAYPLAYHLNMTHDVNYESKQFCVQMTTEKYPYEIHYRIDGKTPTVQDPTYREGESILVGDSALVVAALFEEGQLVGNPTELRLDYHKGIGKKVEWQHRLGGGYPAGGANTALLDGLRGSITYMDGRWLGNIATQSTIGIIDMGEETEINHVSTKCMHDIDPWVYMPEWVELSISKDGKVYEVVERIYSQTDPKDTRLRFETFDFYPRATARYLKIEYHLPLPNKFLFTDEIVIW